MNKRILKNIKKTIVQLFVNSVPINKNIVVFESIPDYSDNSKAVFDEMIKCNLNEKYKLVWLNYRNSQKISGYENVTSIDAHRRLLYYLTIGRAKYIVSCNGIPREIKKNQISIYLHHGIPIKGKDKLNLHLPKYLSYFNVDSEFVKNVQSKDFHFPKEKFVTLGSPRNDVFYKNEIINLANLKKNNSKLVIWYPTFRQHRKAKERIDGNVAIPLINTKENFEKLDSFAKKLKIMIVIKPHFNQNIEYINKYNASNIVFIDDQYFIKNSISSYQLLKGSDALLSDYSSVYYDYLLVNKPIGLIWSDKEDYESRNGFAVDIDEVCSGGQKIYNMDDMFVFLSDVSNNVDKLNTERNIIKNKVFEYNDGKNSERVVNFLFNRQ